MARTTDEKLDDSINIPMPKSLKRRIVGAAEKAPGKPSYTRYAREALKEVMDRLESRQTAGRVAK